MTKVFCYIRFSMEQKDPTTTTTQRLSLLKRSAWLRQLSNTVLLRLLWIGQEQTCAQGKQLATTGNVLLVLDGLLSVNRGTAGNYCLGRGDLLGLEEYLQGERRDVRVRSVGNTQLLRFSWEQLDALAHVCTPWRQFLEQHSHMYPPSSAPPAGEWAEVIAFENHVASVSPRLQSVLILLVAREIAQQFHESVKVLSGPESGLPQKVTLFIPEGAEVKCISWPESAEDSLNTGSHVHDYIFLDNALRSSGPVHKRVYLTDSKASPRTIANDTAPSEPLNVIPASVLPTVLLNKVTSSSTGILKGMLPANKNDWLLPPCRTRFNWQQLEQLSPSELHQRTLDELEIDAETRDSLSRWARAITCRRVGVGLGGGGVWGFYHIVLLNKLSDQSIPVDIVSGASMGSLIAAAYSAQGNQGLKLLVELANDYTLSLMALLSIANTWPIEFLVDWKFGASQLEDLLTIFHPATTDLSNGSGVNLAEGPLGLAVRASSAAPGLYGPTLLAPNRYVDGCVSNNLPVIALINAGADFTFASNCYPAAYRAYSQLLPGKLGTILSELNPLGRVRDLFVSGNIALNSLGVQSALLANVSYDPEPNQWPFLKATMFHHAQEVMENAKNDTALDEAVARFKYLWDTATRSRGVATQAQEAS